MDLVKSILVSLALTPMLAACSGGDDDAGENGISTQQAPGNVVEVTAVHDPVQNQHLFVMSDNEIPSGWTTFRFINASPSAHFFLLWTLPDEAIAAAEAADESLREHWFNAITAPFQVEFEPFHRGEIDYETFVENLVAALQVRGAWFFDPGSMPMGGPGITSVGRTSETTVYLPPGEYMAECYVRDDHGVFHSYIGMLKPLTVTDDAAGAAEPTPTARLTISSKGGFEVDRALRAGTQVIEILFEDQVPYEHFGGHNAHLVKLRDSSDDALLGELAGWMDWRNDDGLVDRAPSGAMFLGGTMDMGADAKAYFRVELEPGEYAWIAEIPDPAAHGMLRVFTVSD